MLFFMGFFEVLDSYPIVAQCSIFIPPENPWFSDVFREYRNRALPDHVFYKNLFLLH